MFKISFSKLSAEALLALKRFPAALLVAFIGTATLIYLIDAPYNEKHFVLYNLVHTAVLGFSFLISISVFCESKKLTFIQNLLFQIIGLALLAGYYFYLPNAELSEIYYFRAALLFIIMHLSVSFVPFILGGSQNDFWEYNKRMFIYILTAALYTVVLFGGLALAILAVDQLFKVNIDDEIYPRLWIFMVGIFNSWFFLSKFPKQYNEQQAEYPTALRLFTQYVLLPLVTIYLLILYGYEIKIIALWELPMGWVSYLIIGFSIVGILALLLLFPLQENEQFKWVRKYTKSFYFALFPLILLLFIAIGKRISDYGITENRYFILILALWLLGTSVFMLIKRLKNIKIIPISLACVALFSTAGPQSAFSVAKYSQFSRLEKILKENNAWKNGKFTVFTKQPSDSVNREIYSIVNHISELYDYKTVRKDFAKLSVNLPDTTLSQYLVTDMVMKKMGLNNANVAYNESGRYFNFTGDTQKPDIIPIEDYQNFIEYTSYFDSYSDSAKTYTFEADSLTIEFNSENNTLTLIKSPEKIFLFDLNKDILKLTDQTDDNYKPLKILELTLVGSSKNMKAKMIIKSIYGYRNGQKLSIQNINAYIFYSE